MCLAGALAKREGRQVRVFLIGDAATAAHANQKVPQGYYNMEVMLGNVARHGGEIAVCGTCMDARGMSAESLMEGAHRSKLEELADWTEWADRVAGRCLLQEAPSKMGKPLPKACVFAHGQAEVVAKNIARLDRTGGSRSV